MKRDKQIMNKKQQQQQNKKKTKNKKKQRNKSSGIIDSQNFRMRDIHILVSGCNIRTHDCLRFNVPAPDANHLTNRNITLSGLCNPNYVLI